MAKNQFSGRDDLPEGWSPDDLQKLLDRLRESTGIGSALRVMLVSCKDGTQKDFVYRTIVGVLCLALAKNAFAGKDDVIQFIDNFLGVADKLLSGTTNGADFFTKLDAEYKVTEPFIGGKELN